MIHTDTFTVNSFQVDVANRVTPVVLFGMMQESASRYCLDNKISIEHLSKNNLTWMLARQYVKFTKFPSWRESVTVETWPRNKTGLRALRDFMVTDENGDEVARSVTNWMLIDTRTRRLCKVDETVKDLVMVEKSVMESDFRIKVDKIDGEKITTLFQVRASDFDVNSHVNNISYIRWVLDTVPYAFQKGHSLSEITAEFVEEISSEAGIESSAWTDGVRFYHELRNTDTERVVFRGLSVWQTGG